MEFKSINPYNGKEIETYKEHSENEVNSILEKSQTAFESWRQVPVGERSKLLEKAADVLKNKPMN